MLSNTRIDASCRHGTLRVGTGALLLALSLGGAFGTGAQAQIVLPKFTPSSPAFAVEVEATTSDKVALLHGLALIESDVHLGLLFAVEHMADPTGSHLSDPINTTWPEVKDGFLAAGIEDFSGLLQQLADAKDDKAIRAAGSEVLKAVVKARSKLGATDAEFGQSVLEITREAAGLINASGPTEAASYQDAWSLVSVARTEADLLMRVKDPAMAKAAVKIGLALDDVILSMPDPATQGPVQFDPSLVTNAAATIEALLDGEA